MDVLSAIAALEAASVPGSVEVAPGDVTSAAALCGFMSDPDPASRLIPLAVKVHQ